MSYAKLCEESWKQDFVYNSKRSCDTKRTHSKAHKHELIDINTNTNKHTHACMHKSETQGNEFKTGNCHHNTPNPHSNKITQVISEFMPFTQLQNNTLSRVISLDIFVPAYCWYVKRSFHFRLNFKTTLFLPGSVGGDTFSKFLQRSIEVITRRVFRLNTHANTTAHLNTQIQHTDSTSVNTQVHT